MQKELKGGKSGPSTQVDFSTGGPKGDLDICNDTEEAA